jgi:ubiquinone/menaquinone biosynthesis C-methylase UbiE
MIQKILRYMRCPRCLDHTLYLDSETLICPGCNSRYPFRQGILDMMGTQAGEVITPFQRLMQAPAIVSIYEKLWRRIGYYLASSRSFSTEMQTVLRLQRNRQNARVLDLACGTGVFTRPLATQGNEVVLGLDMSWPMLRRAQKLLERDGLQNVMFVRATAYALPFTDGAFPHVNCCGALHLFDRPEQALKEIVRILTPDGFFSAQTTIRPTRSAGIAYVLERFIRFGFFGEDELEKMLKTHGFDIIESERHRISFTFLARHQPDPGLQQDKELNEISI